MSASSFPAGRGPVMAPWPLSDLALLLCLGSGSSGGSSSNSGSSDSSGSSGSSGSNSNNGAGSSDCTSGIGRIC